ncbi:hypothetical protein Rhe02_81390 [Rhizocola hellebori]|uniref:XRE family transcriptional regulator n=1 Tax=Rhizocola hellebori TaxID=1392758 RepID=A0A8J3QI42_9ACTN|nr:hypothetical protein Rhe02_81390 [Rhizocola hellebori]
MAERNLSYQELSEVLGRRAKALGTRPLDLSERQLKRLANGQVKSLPTPLTRRVLEAEFGHPIEELLKPAVAVASRSLPVADRSLEMAAQASAGYTMWQGVDELSVSALLGQLGQLAQEYVHGEMTPVADGFSVVRETAIELLPRAGALHRHLYLIASVSSAMLAHAAGNLGDLARAPAHAHAALRFAELGQLPGVGAWALAVLALQQEWSGSPRQSLIFAQQARSYLGSSVESVAVWLSAIEARAYARLGNRPAVNDALQQADRERHAISQLAASEYGVDQFGGILSFGEAKQHYYAGTALRRIGEMDHARIRASAAIAAYETGPAHERSYGDETLARLDLAIAYVLGGDPDLDAADVALQPVTQLPEALLLPVLQGHLGELTAALSCPRMIGSRQAIQLRDTAMALSSMCTPHPTQITR